MSTGGEGADAARQCGADTTVMLSLRAALWLSIAVGVSLELGIHLATGRREAWDSSLYWTVGLPATVLTSVVIGYLSRGRAWLSTLAIVPAHVLTMMVRSGELGGLWPLTVALSAILSAPFVGASWIGSRLHPGLSGCSPPGSVPPLRGRAP
jgi:hypothetical protein